VRHFLNVSLYFIINGMVSLCLWIVTNFLLSSKQVRSHMQRKHRKYIMCQETGLSCFNQRTTKCRGRIDHMPTSLVLLAIPPLIASLGSVTDTLKYNWERSCFWFEFRHKLKFICYEYPRKTIWLEVCSQCQHYEYYRFSSHFTSAKSCPVS
jgi:hypothetical protein